jgi:hypothetical protein
VVDAIRSRATRGEREMRGDTMRRESSVWKFLLAMFLAVGTAVAILPGCADDSEGNGNGNGNVNENVNENLNDNLT